jgi:hypothetical protein
MNAAMRNCTKVPNSPTTNATPSQVCVRDVMTGGTAMGSTNQRAEGTTLSRACCLQVGSSQLWRAQSALLPPNATLKRAPFLRPRDLFSVLSAAWACSMSAAKGSSFAAARASGTFAGTSELFSGALVSFFAGRFGANCTQALTVMASHKHGHLLRLQLVPPSPLCSHENANLPGLLQFPCTVIASDPNARARMWGHSSAKAERSVDTAQVTVHIILY